MAIIDLEPATTTLAAVVAGVADHQLELATPCEELTVGALLDHIHGLALAFTLAASGNPDDLGDADAPEASADSLVDDWRASIPSRLATLADAWRAPGAWAGMTRVGGVDLPGEVCGLVALNEVVVHGWDLAVATGQPYAVDPASAEVTFDFVHGFEPPDGAPAEGVLFGPPVAVPDDADVLDRALGLTGRDPGWRPPST